MENEKVIFTADFNPKIKGYILVTVGLLLLICFITIPILIVWMFGLGQYVSKRYYQSLQCTLTEKHLEFKKGFLFHIEKTIPLENIQDLTFIDNPFLQIFDLRILKVETAGGGGGHGSGSQMKLMGIVDTPRFKEQVMAQRNLRQEHLRQLGSGSAAPTSDDTKLLLGEIRDVLKDIRDK